MAGDDEQRQRPNRPRWHRAGEGGHLEELQLGERGREIWQPALFVGFFLGACAATWTLFVLLCAVAILCVLLLWRLAGSPYFTCTMQVEIDREAFDAKERNPARVSTWQPAREVFRSDSGRLYL